MDNVTQPPAKLHLFSVPHSYKQLLNSYAPINLHISDNEEECDRIAS